MTDHARRADRAWRRAPMGGLVLIALCLIAYVPGLFSIPPVDRDESRFAQASRQVMEAADAGKAEGLLVPQIQDRPRLNKPPLIYWLQGAVAWVSDRDDGLDARPTHQRIGWYRLPSVLCAILAVLATWRAGCVLYRRDEGFIAAVMLALCPMVLWDARQARADELLLACTTLALWALATTWRRHHAGERVGLWRPALLWCCVGLGVLAKGPITPMVLLLALGAMWMTGSGWRFVRTTRPLMGLAIVLAMVLPWAIGVGSIVGFADYWAIVYDETLGRAGSAKESHWGPPGYHFVLLPVLFFPGSLVALLALCRARKRLCRPKRWNETAPETFLLAWVLPSWMVFEFVATKLPHYTLVLYPAIALLCARAVVVMARARRSPGTAGVIVWCLIGLALCAAPVALLAWQGPLCPTFTTIMVGVLVVVALVRLILGALAARRGALRTAIGEASWASIFVAITLCAGVLPALDAPWPSSAIAREIATFDPDGIAPIARTGYHEDSLVFLTRGRAERVGRNRLEAWLDEHPDGLAVVAPTTESPIPPNAQPLAEVSGFNYSTGEPVRLVLVGARVRGPATITDPPTGPGPNRPRP